jgi:excisionase family DNA binding protein
MKNEQLKDSNPSEPHAGTLWNTKEVAGFLNVKESTIRYWTHIGYIPRIKFRGAVRFREADIVEWVNRCVAICQTAPSELASRILRDRR